ncbi:hypothetical protein L913_3483 [Escherichia coli SCD2]|nr:hypothetical protein L913_3483 [Escherichia coli SCD2]EZK25700.1 hypothetical protein AB12_4947 [Escherichia coli 1-182-04_S1_C1]KDU07726.1 hypothetical protein AC34_4555 [Escherichia coli 3-373-03_S3_C2]KEO04821.1 hypothetical protein AB37_4665 [Escherichia coli 8-415-05_S1_C2]CEE06784.1 putative uncharacterized protein [Escherichia coli]
MIRCQRMVITLHILNIVWAVSQWNNVVKVTWRASGMRMRKSR